MRLEPCSFSKNTIPQILEKVFRVHLPSFPLGSRATAETLRIWIEIIKSTLDHSAG
jgi:hypothetical protein